MQPTQLDPQILALTKAFRQVESGGNFQAKGGSNEYGAYQYTPGTWAAQSKQYLGQDVPLTQATPEQQNEVAYKHFADLKGQGYNIGQIASIHNAGAGEPNAYLGTFSNGKPSIGTNSYGVKFNVPSYAKQVAEAYQQFKQQSSQTTNGPVAPAQPQGMSVGGFIQNVGSSAMNVLGGLGQAALHPINTLSTLGSTIGGAVEKPFGVQNQDTQNFDNVVSYFGKKYGGSNPGEIAHNIINSVYTDPVSVGLDLSTLLDGVGAAVGGVGKLADISKLSEATRAAELAKGADFVAGANGVQSGATAAADILKQGQTPGLLSQTGSALKTAADYTNPLTPVTAAASKIAGGAGTLGRSITSHFLSLSDPNTITEILSKPEDFSKVAIEAMNRGSVAEDFGKSIQDLRNSVQENGTAYAGIGKQAGMVAVPENWIQDVLAKGTTAEDGAKAISFGLKLDSEGQVIADTKSFTRDPGALKAVQNFVDNWGDKTSLTPQEFLNMRQDLSKLSKFGKDIGRNNEAEIIARALRADINKTMRPQISGLKTLDETAAPLINQLNRAESDFLTRTPDGGFEFKPGALNKIANATGKGKDALLARMENISPGITKRVQLLKAVEDIESAYKLKVGSYTRGILEGGGFLTGNIPMIAAGIISNPTIAIPLLRGLGYTTRTVAPIVKVIRAVIGNPTALRNISEGAQISSKGTPSQANQSSVASNLQGPLPQIQRLSQQPK